MGGMGHTSNSKFDKKKGSLILNELSSLIGKLVANVAFMRKIGPLHGYLVLAGIERSWLEMFLAKTE